MNGPKFVSSHTPNLVRILRGGVACLRRGDLGGDCGRDLGGDRDRERLRGVIGPAAALAAARLRCGAARAARLGLLRLGARPCPRLGARLGRGSALGLVPMPPRDGAAAVNIRAIATSSAVGVTAPLACSAAPWCSRLRT